MWAIRKPMHKETVFGQVNLRRRVTVNLKDALEKIPAICDKELREYINKLVTKQFNKKQILAHFKSINYRLKMKYVNKVDVWQYSDEKEPMVATRKPIDTSFDDKRIATITDTGIQNILRNYLKAKDNNPNIAFTPEGIAEMNKHITEYNNGKRHQPILKVRVSEPKGAKYQVGETGNKTSKFVEAQKGTNLYFAIYEDKEGNRSYNTIPLIEVIERLKQGLSPVPDANEKGIPLKFHLSPNDLVYVPKTEEENEIKMGQIYKFVDSSGTTANFIPHRVSNLIYNVDKKIAENFCNHEIIQNEYGIGSSQSKNQKSITGEMIKAVCWKLEVDRLGNIHKIIK